MARRYNFRKLLIKGIIPAFVIICMSLTLYCYYLSVRIDKRFSGRRWSIPSKVFSDTTILYPDQILNPDLFWDKLKRLGYKEVIYPPERKGELRRRGDIFDIFLNDLGLPIQKRDGFPVKIVLKNRTIIEITRSQEHDPIPILELGSEELMLFFGREREQRRLISIKDVPDRIQKAFLAAEDIRFYKHHGIDLRGILRAIYTNIRKMGIYQGGSTITQ